MKQTINFFDFTDTFKQCGRKDQFSYAGLRALFDYLEDLEEQCDMEIELDVIALCCDYTEYRSLEDFQADYGNEYEEMDDIMDDTVVIMIDDESFIIANF